MKIQEDPPRNNLENNQTNDHNEQEMLDREALLVTQTPRSEEEQQKIEILAKEIAQAAKVEQPTALEKAIKNRDRGDERLPQSKTPWFRRAAMGAMFTLGSLFGMAKESKAAEGTAPVKKATTESVAKNTPSDSTKNTVEVYTKAKTEKGGITPTGLSNSFLENEYGVTLKDLYEIAEKYGFSTKNQVECQRDILKFAQKNDPEIIQYILSHFGQTEYGLKNKMAADNPDQLFDGILGARTAYILKFYKDKEDPTENDNEVAPYSEFAQDGETMFTPGAGSRAIGELCYPTRNTDDVKKHGGLETSRVAAILRLRDDFGFTGEVVELTTDEIQDFFGATKHAKDGDVLAKIKEKAKMIASK